MLLTVLFAILLLGLGVFLRSLLPILQWMMLPACIVGGALGLLLVQSLGLGESDFVKPLEAWPGLLIAVVFAAMALERGQTSFSKSLRQAAQEGIVVWIVVLGQTAVGLLCTWLLIQPFYDVPNSFGMLIETGFAGGHGTAAAMGDVFESEVVGLDDGRDLGLFMATVGLVFSVLSGMVYVNLAARLGWLRKRTASLPAATAETAEERRVQVGGRIQPIALGRIAPQIVDPLAFQLLILGAAFGVGWLAKESVSLAVDAMTQVAAPENAAAGEANAENVAAANEQLLKNKTSLASTIGGFPLFIYTLFGGIFVRRLMEQIGLGHLIDAMSIQRLSGISMEFLVVAAIATLRIEAVAGVLVPLLILLAAAFVWTGFCLLVVSRRLLPAGYWFELGILNYGMSTGTTATGFTLLKVVDPELESGAAEDYALAAPLSSPFIGGGMLTVALPMLLLERVPIAISSIGLLGIVAVLFVIGAALRQRLATNDSDS